MAFVGGNKGMVESLYASLAAGDTTAVSAVLATDLEWWFHGPPRCEHMMRVLTGESTHREFRFEPRRLAEVGIGWVVAEGWEGDHAYWVHVWALEGGVITQFREYFNTCVTVRDLGPVAPPVEWAAGKPVWPTVWQSEARDSLPGLVLAI